MSLVGQHLADEQPVVAAFCPFGGETTGRPRVRREIEVGRVEHEGSDHRVPITGVFQIQAIELGHGDTELGERRQLDQLLAAEPDLLAERRHPSLDELGRADVVVVDELQARV